MKPVPFRLERYFARHEFTAPYLLCCSDCETLSVQALLDYEEGAAEGFLSLTLGYTDSRGCLALRKEISSLYRTVSPDGILVHAGAEEAIFNFMNATLSPGDRIIVQSPYYQSLGEVARAIGAEVLEWKGDPAESWALHLDTLKRLLNARTRVVVVNLPHNPTGFLPAESFVRELVGLAEHYGFVVFADEVYRGLEYEPDSRLPACADLSRRCVSLGVMSKTYGLAGLRIGWIAARDPAILEDLATFKDYTTICSSAPSEYLATVALRHRDAVVARNLSIIRANLHHLRSFFPKHEELFGWQPPAAGPVAFVRYRGESAARFCRELVEQTGVLLLPGTLFGPDYRDFFRIGFGRRDLPDCLDRLRHYLGRA